MTTSIDRHLSVLWGLVQHDSSAMGASQPHCSMQPFLADSLLLAWLLTLMTMLSLKHELI